MLKLHHSPTSPYVRKVMVLLAETGQSADVALLPASGSPIDPGTMPVTQNPLGKIPALERPDGPALFDSRVICRYLDDRAKAGLYPAAPRLWETLTLESMADGMVDAAILMVYESRLRPEEIRLPAWVEGQWSKVARALDMLEARWLPYLSGPLCMGQIALGCAIGYIDFRHDARNWRATRPGLAAWDARFAARPAMVATRPPAA
ncbi:MAG: glutathione S-transferase [Gemmobacter sp.]|jgi:glutathione S-transferase